MRIDAAIEERENQVKYIEFQSWLTGAYVLRAIGCAMSKKNKYPDNPLTQQEEEYIVVDDMELSEEEKEAYTKMWFERLEGMANKNKLSKGR